MIDFIIPEKRCTKCNVVKTLINFPKRRDAWCRDCKNQDGRNRHAQGGKPSIYVPERHQRRYRELKNDGLCVECKVLPARPNRVHCVKCSAKMVEKQRRIKKAKHQGVCADCNNPKLPNAKTCQDCYLKALARRNLGSRSLGFELLQKLKDQNFQCAHTKECIVLGLNDSIDHVFPSSRYPHLKTELSNIEWVTRRINTMKSDLTRIEFLDTMRLILELIE